MKKVKRPLATVPLPKDVFSPFGPLKVRPLDDPDEAVFGKFLYDQREVQLRKSACAETQWNTVLHEMTHIALWDSGAHAQLTEEQEEAVCDAVAAYLTAALHNGYIDVH